MPRFGYIAQDQFGNRLTGEIFSPSVEGLKLILLERSLQVVSVWDLNTHVVKMKTEISPELGDNIRLLSSGGKELISGLASLEKESSSRVRDESQKFREHLERGGNDWRGGGDLRLLLELTTTSPESYADCERYSSIRERTKEIRWKAGWEAFCTPLIAFGVTIVWAIWLSAIAPSLRDMLEDFSVKISFLSQILLDVSTNYSGLLITIPVVIELGYVGLLVLESRGLFGYFPVLSRINYLTRCAEFTALAGLQLKYGRRLPDSLQQAAEITGNRWISRVTPKIIRALNRGDNIPKILGSVKIPKDLAQPISWCEHDRRGELLIEYGEILGHQAYMGMPILTTLVNILTIFMMAFLIGFTVYLAFAPTITTFGALI